MAGIEAADWNLRTPGFEQLREIERDGQVMVCMQFAPPLAKGLPLLSHSWKKLRHPHELELVDTEGDRALLRFAAIDWRAQPALGDALANAIKLVHLFEHVIATLPFDEWVWFQDPKVFFDLRGEPRVLWQPVGVSSFVLAPEARQHWPHCSEKTLVYTLGRLMSELGVSAHPKAALLVKRCLEPRSGRRIAKLKDVRITLQQYMRMDPPGISPAWDAIEAGIGWLELDRRPQATERFERALELDPRSQVAADGLARAADPTSTLADVEYARRLEAGRFWIDAIEVYRRSRDALVPADYLVALARCYRGLSHHQCALELARRAAAEAPEHVEAWQTIIDAAISLRNFAEAHLACERLAALAPRDAVEALAKVIDEALVANGQQDVIRCADTLIAFARMPELADRVVVIIGAAVARMSVSGEHLSSVFALCDRLHSISAQHGIKAFGALAARGVTKELDRSLTLFDRLYALSPTTAIDAFTQVVEVELQRGELAPALAIADHLVALAPDNALAQYRRGRCLLHLGRLTEAHAALERAVVLAPKLTEAMLLRREVDRAVGKLRAVVGTAIPSNLHIPEHLTEVRAAMARGAVDDAVAWLESHAIGDGAVRLLLGHLLFGKSRYADAVVAFDRVSGELVHTAVIGKARALVALGRGEEALRLLDRVCAEQPELTEAVVVRARVVALLRDLPSPPPSRSAGRAW